jgi:uncharacterized protein YjbI with pentapeptide repeats
MTLSQQNLKSTTEQTGATLFHRPPTPRPAPRFLTAVYKGKTSSSSLGITKETRVWFKQYFTSCPILGCNLSGASLAGCDLRALSVKNSTFESTNLQAADLRKCDVSGVDLSTANLLDTNLTECTYSDGTQFPHGFSLPIASKNFDEARHQRTIEQNDPDLIVSFCVVLGVGAFLIFVVIILNP